MQLDALPVQVVRSAKLADLVARDLRMLIVQGKVKEGAELPTLDRLAARFGVSLSIVREAVRILETENLLSVRRGPKGGVTVRAPSLETLSRNFGFYLQHQQTTIEDLLTAQLSIEPFCVRLLASKPAPKVTTALSKKVDHAGTLLAEPERLGRVSTEFQHMLVVLTGNKSLTAIHASLLRLTELEIARVAPRYVDLLKDPVKRRKISDFVDRMRRLVDLIAAGDVARAETHWRKHLETENRQLLSLDDAKLLIDLFGPAEDEPQRRGGATSANLADSTRRPPKQRPRRAAG